MKHHRFDPVSFTFGLLFALVAAGLSIGGLDFGAPAIRWIGAGFLLLLGILLMTTSRTANKDRS
jgi:hypothetical protein